MKKFISKIGFSVATLLPVMFLGAHSTLAEAQDSEPKIYKCKHCVKYTGWRGELDFGLGYVSDDSFRFGDYRGLESEGVYAALDGDIHYRDLQGTYFDLYARNFGYDSRELDLRVGNTGHSEIRFGWQEIPKYRGYGTQTPFIGVGSDHLTLPEDWVYANTTSGMDALDNSLRVASLKTQRTILDLGATMIFASDWTFRADYQNQRKKGTRTLGAGMYYTNASILPAPVDFSTEIIDLGLKWGTQRAQVELGFLSSVFDNGKTALTWQNPFKHNAGHDYFRAALEPDNKFHQFSLKGAFAFTPGIKISGNAALGKMTQDNPFLPYTINPRYSDLPLPRTSLDGRIDASTYNLAGKFSARINSKLSFTARGKWDERDNKTPVDTYTAVVTDLIPTAPRYNRPYSYKRKLYSADLRYRAHRVVRLSGGARWEDMDRTLQAVESTKETIWWGEAKIDPTYTTQVRFKLESGDRDVSDYQQPLDGGPVDHPLMRKYNMADRKRDRVLIDFDFMVTEALGLNLGYIQAKADYNDSPLGLQKSDDRSYSANLNYALGQKLNLYAFYNLDNIEADIINTRGGNSVPWNAATKDRIETYGIGLTADISEKSSLGVDYVSAVSKGDISVQTSREEDPFDSLKTNLKSFKIHFDYDFSDRWGYKLYAELEDYTSADWAIDDYGVDGINSVLSMGELSPDYRIWYYRFQLSYRF